MSRYTKVRRAGGETQSWRLPAILALALFIALMGAEVMALMAPGG